MDFMPSITRFQIFSYITQSRSLALGQSALPTNGVFGASHNLQSFGYDGAHYSHSREFRSDMAAERGVWKLISRSLPE